MSLLGMINFNLFHFVAALSLLRGEQRFAMERATSDPDAIVREADMSRFLPKFKYASDWFDRLNLSHARQRAERLAAQLRLRPKEITYSELVSQLNTLMEAVEDDSKFERFFHYRQDRVQPFMSRDVDWAATIAAFPAATNEITEGLDCYGLEHNTACIFHMMRVAEMGMRALARERQVSFPKHPLEWADWQNILEQTEKRAKAATDGMPRGPKKDAMQAFYSSAIGQLHGFKDTYRNVVMHVRRSYDESDALRAINQVRDFMNCLSAKIGEKTKTPIRRWP